MFGKLREIQIRLLLEFIFGFELFQNNEILRTAGKLEFTGESDLNKLRKYKHEQIEKIFILLPTWQSIIYVSMTSLMRK